MPFSGGVYTRDNGTNSGATTWAQDKAAGTKITSDRHDAHDQDIATALNQLLLRDGSNTVTGNLDFGGFRVTNAGVATVRTDLARLSQVQDGTANWADAGGTADAITATYSPAVTALLNGQLCFVRAAAANATTTPTFSPNGLTAGTIVKEGGTALLAGDIAGDGHELVLRYDSTNTRWELINPSSAQFSFASQAEAEAGTNATAYMNPLRTAQAIAALTAYPSGYLRGMGLSNGTDADHDIDFAAGIARDEANGVNIDLSALTKRIDASWAAGTGNGGLASSQTLSSDTWYHVFAIIVGGAADAGFDTSVTAANLVSDHSATAYRRIGSVLTDGSANIIAFTQNGNEFLWSVPVEDVATANPGTSAVTPTLSTPLGIQAGAMISVNIEDGVTTAINALLTSPDQADTAPSATVWTLKTRGDSSQNVDINGSMTVCTDTSSRIRYRLDRSSATVDIGIVTRGWVDTRGMHG